MLTTSSQEGIISYPWKGCYASLRKLNWTNDNSNNLIITWKQSKIKAMLSEIISLKGINALHSISWADWCNGCINAFRNYIPRTTTSQEDAIIPESYSSRNSINPEKYLVREIRAIAKAWCMKANNASQKGIEP